MISFRFLIIIRPRPRRWGVGAYSRQIFPWTICRSVHRSVYAVHCGKRRIGSDAISATQCEKGNNPQTAPSPCMTYPHLMQQCLGPPHAPPQTAAPTVEALSHTYAVKSPLVTMACYKFAPKVPLPVDRSPSPTTYLIPGPVRPMMPNGIRIRSAIFPQCTGQTDRPTDRSFTGKFGDYSPLRYDSDATYTQGRRFHGSWGHDPHF